MKPLRPTAPRLFFVAHDTPEETTTLFESACSEQGVRFVYVDAPSFRYRDASRARAGDLLYRAATSLGAIRVEQFLAEPGVATLYHRPDGAFLHNTNAALWLSRSGLATPRTLFGAQRDRACLREDVASLGGLPVVVKTLGFSDGAGVFLAESWAALFAMVDYAHAHGHEPLLREYLPNTVHWRVVVVGERAVLAYSNPRRADDFRTSPTADRAAYHAKVPARLARLAERATAALDLEHGGVDVLVLGRRQVVLEVNFPCYFAHAQRISGVDVAGGIVGWLAQKPRK